MECDSFLISVDVGSAEVRAALVDKVGKVLSVSTEKIKIWSPQSDYFQQSSEDIWASCKKVIKEVKKSIDSSKIKGIGCDATCSLVAVGKNGKPISISPKGESDQNIIMWMDHRAFKEAEFINSFDHHLLNYVGGKVSLEMEMPKLLWLKKNLYAAFSSTEKFFDLPDFLVWKLTGFDIRSSCSLVCKWMFEWNPPNGKGWNKEFIKMIDLEELIESNFSKIGSEMKAPGEPVGNGLSPEVANELGLSPGIAVSTSLIDAHAGGVGLISSHIPNSVSPITNIMAMICGTSSCHMVQSRDPKFVKGVWGPYYSAMIPSLWLTEGGQSCTGQLLDNVLTTHSGYPLLLKKFGSHRCVIEYLNNFLCEMAAKENLEIDCLTSEFHVYPDYRGNRSPLADPTLTGMICGLTLDKDETESMAVLYLAVIQSLAYSTKHIIEVLEENGQGPIECILMCGGLSKNKLFVEIHSNAMGRPVAIPEESECVLLGGAMLAATAAKLYPSLIESSKAMASKAVIVTPNKKLEQYHANKYAVFKKMLSDQAAYKDIMKQK